MPTPPRSRRPLLALLAISLSLAPLYAGEVRWSAQIADADGWLVAAAGDDGGSPLRVTVSREMRADHLRVTTTFVHGMHTLALRRDYDPGGALTLRCTAGSEQLLIEARRNPVDGGIDASFHVPDGRRLALAMAADGTVQRGDGGQIVAALAAASHLAERVRDYRRATSALRDRLPLGGENLLPGAADRFGVESPGGCWDQCAAGCAWQCAWECAIGGPVCDLCNLSCALGCAIGCGPKKQSRE